jgi:hypothetical protein
MTQQRRYNRGYYPSQHGNLSRRRINTFHQLPNTEVEPIPTEETTPPQNIGGKWNVADKIALFGLLVNISLAIATFMLYYLSVNAANSAKIAADAAKVSADLQIVSWDSTKAAKTQSDIADAEKLKRDTDFVNKQKTGIDAQIAAFKKNEQYNNEVFRLNSRAMELQIKSLKETQKEFEIENRPLIQVAPVRIDSVSAASKIVVYGIVNNFGKQPAKIIYMNIKSVYSELRDFSDFASFPKKEINVNMYIAGNSNFPISLRHDNIEPEERVNKMLNGKAFEYFIGEVKYINTVTNKTMLYRFSFRISVYPYYNILPIVDTTFNKSILAK